MATPASVHAHAPQGFIRKYIFSLDHKVIGIQYFFLALTAVFVGMFLSLLMRIHLIWPAAVLPLVGEIKPETYLSLLTMHGTIMVFFVLTTAPQGGFGNYFLPIQIGAPDMAFPVLNIRGDHRGLLRNRRSAAARLDGIRSAQRTAVGRTR
jgi:cytochrome c oxidase subunit 1